MGAKTKGKLPYEYYFGTTRHKSTIAMNVQFSKMNLARNIWGNLVPKKYYSQEKCWRSFPMMLEIALFCDLRVQVFCSWKETIKNPPQRILLQLFKNLDFSKSHQQIDGSTIHKISLCSTNQFFESGSLFKVSAGRGELFKNSGRFSRAVQKRKSSHNDEYGHGQEKRRPSGYVEGTENIVEVNE